MSDITTQDRIGRIKALVADITLGLIGTVEKTIEVGEHLLAEKAALDHGQFQAWVETNFRFSYKTARRWMTVAENKKDVLKRLKGGNLESLSEAYSVKTAGLALSGPTATAPSTRSPQVARSAAGSGEVVDWVKPSVPLKRHKILARGGRVLTLTDGNPTPSMIYQGTLYLDPVVGMEWAHRDALANLDKGLQLLFENYFLQLEREEDGEPQPMPEPRAVDPEPATPAVPATAVAEPPLYKSTLDEDDE